MAASAFSNSSLQMNDGCHFPLIKKTTTLYGKYFRFVSSLDWIGANALWTQRVDMTTKNCLKNWIET